MSIKVLMQTAVLTLLLALLIGRADAQRRGLDIYFVDTEGGAATLLVTPLGESILIDCGNPGDRDAERIHKVAVEVAKLKAIDHLIITHWHLDHYGGVAGLAQGMPIRNFYDRGIPDMLAEDPDHFPTLIAAYKTASQGKSTELRPGDEVVLKQKEKQPLLRLLCLCANHDVLPERPNAPANPLARQIQLQPEDTSDNARSLGFLLSYGDFRFLDLGDLTQNIEAKLVSPSNKIGLIDVMQASHHGLDVSNNPVLIQSVKPRVAVFANGPHKGANPKVVETLRAVPGLQAIYQQHRNLDVASEWNAPAEFIANAEPTETCKAEYIKISVAPDSKSYTVTVGSAGKPKQYATRTGAK